MLVPFFWVHGVDDVEYFKAKLAMNAIFELQCHPHFRIFFFKSFVDFVDFFYSLRQLKILFLGLFKFLIKFTKF